MFKETPAFFFFFKVLFIFLERGGGQEKEGVKHQFERETSISCSCMHPDRGLNPQPRHVPRPGIEPATPHFVR